MEFEKLTVINLNSKSVCDEMIDGLYHEITRALSRNGEVLINKVSDNQVQTLARAILSYAPFGYGDKQQGVEIEAGSDWVYVHRTENHSHISGGQDEYHKRYFLKSFGFNFNLICE